MKIRNLTPHPVHVIVDGVTREIPAEKPVPRVSQETVNLGTIDGIPLVQIRYSDVTDLPAKEADTYLIVSALVANHPDLRDRDDLLVPADLVRDERGTIIGARALARVNAPSIANKLIEIAEKI